MMRSVMRGVGLGTLCVLLMGLIAVPASAGAANVASPGPGARPVACSPAPCGQDGQPALPSGEMPESSVVHIAITPHVIQPNGFITLKLSYSGIGHCDVAQGSVCTQGLAEAGLVRVDCSTHKVLGAQSIAVQNEHTQCYTLPQFSAPTEPFYAVIEALEGNCSAVNDVADCVSADYVLVEPPCGGASASVADASGSARARQVGEIPLARGAEVSGAGTCPLKVFVRVVGPIVNVGTRSGLAVDHKDGVVNFTVNTVSKLGSVFAGPVDVGERCMSGCANLLVTVTDPRTGDPVPDATVTATLGQLGAAKSISGALAGEQFLCLQSDHPGANSCGASLSSLSNAKGQLYLIYWAPGETAMSTSSISVTAKKCSSSCTAGQQEGSAQTGVTIMPYTIYEHDDGTISAAEITSLMTAVGEGKLYNKNHEAASEEGFELAIHWLANQDKAAKKLVSAVLGPVGYSLIKLVEVAQLLAEAHSGLKEEQLLVAALLEAVDMPGIGMFDEPFEHDIPAEPNSYLRQAVISGLGLADGIGGGSGVLWDLGKALIEQYSSISKSFAVQPEHVDVKVDEISSCNSARADCGPGYPAQSGIRPRLCLILAFSNHAPGNDRFGTNFCMSQYDPVAFAVTQSDLNTELPGS
jgi:hypothetical protein